MESFVADFFPIFCCYYHDWTKKGPKPWISDFPIFLGILDTNFFGISNEYSHNNHESSVKFFFACSESKLY